MMFLLGAWFGCVIGVLVIGLCRMAGEDVDVT